VAGDKADNDGGSSSSSSSSGSSGGGISRTRAVASALMSRHVAWVFLGRAAMIERLVCMLLL
jgi:hypothetical protein